MSVEFKVAHTRKTEYLIDPSLIKVRPEMNGRTELPDIEWLVESMVAIGQRVPVEIRSDAGKPVLNSGYSRWRAAVEINKKKLVEGKFLLRCVYARCNEQEGFIANIHENHVRNAPTALDDAYNIRRLESWGRSYEEIAEIYHRRNGKGEPDTRWVKNRLGLIALGNDARQALKDGRLKPTAAQAIAKLSEEQQRERVKGTGKVAAPPKARAERIGESGAAILAKANDGLLAECARYRKTFEAISVCTLVGPAFTTWLDYVCGELYKSRDPQCWNNCGAPVHGLLPCLANPPLANAAFSDVGRSSS